jgi:hypothetical protein
MDRGPNDTIKAISRRARVSERWFYSRRKNREWRDWFLRELAAHDKLVLIDVRDEVIRQFRADKEAGRRPDVQMLRFLKEWLEPTITALELRREPPEQHITRRDMIVEIAAFLEQEGDGHCEHCGNPLIPYKLWKRGLERGEEMLLEGELEYMPQHHGV